jgi:hypothetical protein
MKLYKLTVSGVVMPLLFSSRVDADGALNDAFAVASLAAGWVGTEGSVDTVDLCAYQIEDLGINARLGHIWAVRNLNQLKKVVSFGND